MNIEKLKAQLEGLVRVSTKRTIRDIKEGVCCADSWNSGHPYYIRFNCIDEIVCITSKTAENAELDCNNEEFYKLKGLYAPEGSFEYFYK